MNKQLIEECKAIYNQFTGIGDDEDYMWQEVIDYASNQQNEALLAQIEELRKGLEAIKNMKGDYQSYSPPLEVWELQDKAERVLKSVHSQSLSSLKSSVEEEVIDHCLKAISSIETTDLTGMVRFGLDRATEAVYDLPRKYKEEG